jgi:hypothetical protein
MNRWVFGLAVVLGGGLAGATNAADDAGHATHHPMDQAGAAAATPQATRDDRQLVAFPGMLRAHTLSNMRDHLQTLGMSSLEMHGAHEVAQFMPKGMQDAGSAMHRSASQFALVAKDASATGDLRPALAALSKLNQTCVACHAAYRLQ